VIASWVEVAPPIGGAARPVENWLVSLVIVGQ